jgi:hypothetical protein
VRGGAPFVKAFELPWHEVGHILQYSNIKVADVELGDFV